jgi:hypothetical protein
MYTKSSEKENVGNSPYYQPINGQKDAFKSNGNSEVSASRVGLINSGIQIIEQQKQFLHKGRKIRASG